MTGPKSSDISNKKTNQVYKENNILRFEMYKQVVLLEKREF